MGTKLDLVVDGAGQDSMKKAGEALAKSQNRLRMDELKTVPYFETSSKNGENVEVVFNFILQTCLPLNGECEEKTPSRKKSDGCVDLNKPRNHSDKKKKCC